MNNKTYKILVMKFIFLVVMIIMLISCFNSESELNKDEIKYKCEEYNQHKIDSLIIKVNKEILYERY